MLFVFITYAFVILTLVVTIFQLALALGAPLGEYTMGGRYPGKLPQKIRLMAIIQILVLAFFAVIVLTRTGIIFEPFFKASRVAIWFIAGFFVLGSIANISSPSVKEKRLWGPVNILMLVLSILIALS
jgi:hypothetical protein